MHSDVRLLCRGLLRSPGFALLSICTFAVGIGATTVIFSALRALVIAPLHYPQPEEVVHVWSGDRWSLSPADFIDLREQSSSFTAFGVYQPQSMNVGREPAQSVAGVTATSDVLRALGIRLLSDKSGGAAG